MPGHQGPQRESTIVENEPTVEVPAELRDHLQEQLGDGLRLICHYNSDAVTFEEFEIAEEYSDKELQNILDDLRIQDLEQHGQEGLYSIGNLYCTIRAFDDAVLLHFIQDERRGTLVSVEPTAISNLSEIISNCLQLLDDYSNQEISHVPEWHLDQ